MFRSFLLFVPIALLAGCTATAPVEKQVADKVDCIEVTGSRVPRCGDQAKKNSDVKTVSPETLDRALKSSGAGDVPGSGTK
jgi:hypothetical protein